MKHLLWIAVLVTAFAVPAFGQESVVKKVRETYPAGKLSDPQKVLLLSDVARALGPEWGVLASVRPGGNICRVPGDSTLYRCDHVCRFDGSLAVDVLADEEGAASPVWRVSGSVPSSRTCVAPLGGATPAPDPDPAPDPEPAPSCDLSAVLTKLEALSGEQQAFIDLWLKEQERARQAQEQHAQSLEEHRGELRKAKGWARRWLVEKVLPIVGGVAAGWFSRPKDE